MPKEVFGRDYAFLPRDQILSVRGDRAGRPRVRRARGREAADHRRRADSCGGTCRTSSRCWPRCGRATATARPDPDHQRLRPARARPAARRRGPASGDGQPRLARRRGLRRDERHRLPGRARARRDRRGARGRPRPGQDQHGRPTRASTRTASCRWRAGRATPGSRSASSSTWTSGHSNGWRLDEVVPARDLIATVIAAVAARAGRPRRIAARSPTRWRYLDGRGEFGVISSVTRPFCGDCTRARLSAEGKLYTCLFAVAATTSGRSCARLVRRASCWRVPRRDIWRAATIATRSCGRCHRDATDLPKVEMFAMGG